MNGMIYRITLSTPAKFFRFLPPEVQQSMLKNIVDVVNQTGTATSVGENPYDIIVPWCEANCSKRFCWDGETHTLLFESADDCMLFMTARPQTRGEWP